MLYVTHSDRSQFTFHSVYNNDTIIFLKTNFSHSLSNPDMKGSGRLKLSSLTPKKSIVKKNEAVESMILSAHGKYDILYNGKMEEREGRGGDGDRQRLIDP